MTEQDEQNRRIAEWIEPEPTVNGFTGWHPEYKYRSRQICHCYESWHTHNSLCFDQFVVDRVEWTPINFLTDEAASALIVEKARFAVMPAYVYVNGVLQSELEEWFVGPRNVISSRIFDIKPLAHHPVRLTAVRDAALVYLDLKEKA